MATLPIHGATISVTTTDDVVALDGECSLREAVTAANANVAFSDCPSGEPPLIIDVIELPPGVYSLTLEPAGEDLNLGGDLDITEPVTLRGLGDEFIWWDDPVTPDVEILDVFNDPDGFPRAFTEDDLPDVIIENGLGKIGVPGDGERVIHTLPPGPGDDLLHGLPSAAGSQIKGWSAEGEPLPVTFENLAIARGDDVCSGELCADRGAGIYHSVNAHLVLDKVALFDNRIGCLGFNCGSNDNAAAVHMAVNRELRISRSVLAENRATCADTQCRTGRLLSAPGLSLTASAEIRETLVAGNRQACSATDCRSGQLMSLRGNNIRLVQSVVTQNEISCTAAGFDCVTETLIGLALAETCSDPTCFVDLSDLELSENTQACDGATCSTGEFLRVASSFFDKTFQRLRIRDNEQSCIGPTCRVDPLFTVDARSSDPTASMILQDLEILDNLNRCEGNGCIAGGTYFGVGEGIATLSNVSVRGEGLCLGEECSALPVLSIVDFASISGLNVAESEVSCTGTGCDISPLVDIFYFEEPLDPLISDLNISDSQGLCTGVDCGFGGSSNPDFLGEGGILRFCLGGEPGEIRLMADGVVLADNTTHVQGVLALDGHVELRNSSLTGNMSLDGGAIHNGTTLDLPQAPGFLTLRDTVVSGNEAILNGGGVYNAPSSALSLINSSIVNNTALDGGGVFNEGAILQQQGAMIVGNTPNQCVDSGLGIGCDALFIDGFESGDTNAWSGSVQ